MPQHHTRNRLLALTLAATMACPCVSVAQPATQYLQRAGTTTTTKPASQPIRATITAVRGMVEVKLSETGPWQPAKPEMVVEEGAEFRTGPRSAVQFVIPPDQTITLDRLGTVKLLTAIRQATGKTKTDLGMKYGRTRYDIAAGGVEHDSTIRSPNSTLAVRGTIFSLTDERPFPPTAVSLQGQVQYKPFRKQAVAFGGTGKAKVEGDKNNAAESAFDETFVDPSLAFARDAAEQQLVATLISQGAVVSLDRSTGIRTVRGGTVPTDAQLLPLLPGDLNFVLRWQGNANLDFGVGLSGSGGAEGQGGSEVVYPVAELSRSASGGQTAFDHQGGRNGGIEIISWPASFPRTTYITTANIVSGPSAVPANLQVYLDGRLCTKTIVVLENGVPVFREVGCLVVGFDPEGFPIFGSSLDVIVTPPPPDRPGDLRPIAPVILGDLPPASQRTGAAAKTARRVAAPAASSHREVLPPSVQERTRAAGQKFSTSRNQQRPRQR